jgi:hypothetical protein
VLATRASLHALPPGKARERWTDELVAELWGLSRAEQLKHTAGVLARTWALRAAVTSRERLVEEDIMRRPWRCRFGWHRFETRYATDGTGRYLACRRCSKEEEVPQHPRAIA